MTKNCKIVLALGGGGARGLAHLGVIQSLEEHKIPIRAIAGTSMGAIAGALYAETMDIKAAINRMAEYFECEEFEAIHTSNFKKGGVEDFWTQLFNRFRKQLAVNIAAQKISLGDAGDLFNAIDQLILSKRFEDLQLPFICIADDLKSGKKVIFNSGKLKPALAASSAIPGILPPVEIGEYLLCDGMLTSVIPTVEAKELGNFIIAVDVRQEMTSVTELNSALDILVRADVITSHFRADILGEKADVLISPAVGKFVWSDFKNWKEIIKSGYDATNEKIPEILDKIKYRHSITYRYGYKPLHNLTKRIINWK